MCFSSGRSHQLNQIGVHHFKAEVNGNDTGVVRVLTGRVLDHAARGSVQIGVNVNVP